MIITKTWKTVEKKMKVLLIFSSVSFHSHMAILSSLDIQVTHICTCKIGFHIYVCICAYNAFSINGLIRFVHVSAL